MIVNGNMVRAVSFLKPWRGKVGRDDKRDIDMTQGQREILVMRGLAEFVEEKTEPRGKKNQRESAAIVE